MANESLITPVRIERSESLSHRYLNSIADLVVQRMHVTGGRAKRVGTNFVLEIDLDKIGGAKTVNLFLARITAISNEAGFANARWTYGWVEVELVDDEDSDLAGGRSGTTSVNPAINLVEMNNTTDPGIGGDGIDTSGADYPAGFTRQPIPLNAIVMMFERTNTTGTTKYVFSQVNAHDGTCT